MNTNDSTPELNASTAEPTKHKTPLNIVKVLAVTVTILLAILAGASYYVHTMTADQPVKGASSAVDHYSPSILVDAPQVPTVSQPKSSVFVKKPFFSVRRNVIIVGVAVGILLLVAAAVSVILFLHFDQSSAPIESVRDAEEPTQIEETLDVQKDAEKNYSDIIKEFSRFLNYLKFGFILLILSMLTAINYVWTSAPELKKKSDESWGMYFNRNILFYLTVFLSLTILTTVTTLAIIFPETASSLVIPFAIVFATFLCTTTAAILCNLLLQGLSKVKAEEQTSKQCIAKWLAYLANLVSAAIFVAYYFFNQDYYGVMIMTGNVVVLLLALGAVAIVGPSDFIVLIKKIQAPAN